MSSDSKTITLPCRRYFEERLLFFLQAKYFPNRQLSEEENNICDKSLKLATIEFGGYDTALEMLEKEGYTVTIEQRKFSPMEVVAPEVTDVTDSISPPDSSSDTDSSI